MCEFPADLVELQQELLRVEALYQRRVAAVYGHPVMREARADGQLDAVSSRLREVARAA